MNRLSLVVVLLSIALAGCTGDAGVDPGPGTGTGTGTGTSPCTDATKCCTTTDMECLVDPDSKPICKCYKLWNCDANPKKCSQDMPTPQGGSNWKCTWTSTTYSCSGTSTSTPGGGGQWRCTKTGTDQWTCDRPSPNPTNTPEGGSGWTCSIDEFSKLNCTKNAPPAADAGVAPKADRLVLKPDTTTPPNTFDCYKGNNGALICNKISVTEPCPPGAYQNCDCYCGVHRKCKADGTWGPCVVDGIVNYPTWGQALGIQVCEVAKVTTQAQCGSGTVCDFGRCIPINCTNPFSPCEGQISNQCVHMSDCPLGQICDLGECRKDPYNPLMCP
jgi:hypothetical protein